ncbi:MAG: hypothetical protein LBK13_11575 [Spirochaetales bacterium]|jgi:hypothetical protein|nr:hypothetical protein [Spirochaetales bacterium]
MELNYIDCPSGSAETQLPVCIYGLHRLGDTLLLHSNDEISAWDISNPLDIRQTGACPIDFCVPNSVLYDQKLCLFYRNKMQPFDVSDLRNIHALTPVLFAENIRSLDFDREGTVWVVTEYGTVGAQTTDGKFTEHVPYKIHSGFGKLDINRSRHIKTAGDLVIVAHQEYGVLIYRKNAGARLELLTHITQDSEICFEAPVTPVCGDQVLLFVSYLGITPVDARDVNTIKKSNRFKPKYELWNMYGPGIIDCGRSDELPENTHDILVYSEANGNFELCLLEVSPAGITHRDSVQLKHRKFDGLIRRMFLKDNYLIFVGMSGHADRGAFEVYRITK